MRQCSWMEEEDRDATGEHRSQRTASRITTGVTYLSSNRSGCKNIPQISNVNGRFKLASSRPSRRQLAISSFPRSAWERTFGRSASREGAMTRSRYRIYEDCYPYFLTCTIVGWLPVFTRPETVQIIYDS